MDIKKINKAAEESAIILYRNLSDPDVSEDGRTVSMFMSMFERGTDWLMQQPLSERLNDAERDKIRAIYAETQEWLAEKPNGYNSTLKVVSVLQSD